MNESLYYLVITGGVIDLVLTGAIFGFVLQRAASAMPMFIRILFHAGQFVEGIIPIFMFFVVQRSWSAIFLSMLAVMIWSRVLNQSSVLLFHLNRWGKSTAP